MSSTVLRNGIDCLVISVGALADAALFEKLKSAAHDGNSRILLPAGAIGGLDAIAAMRLSGLTSVRYRSRKPPLAWRGSPAESRWTSARSPNARCSTRAPRGKPHCSIRRTPMSLPRWRSPDWDSRLRRSSSSPTPMRRQRPRDRGRGRGRALCDRAAGQAVAHEPEDLCLGGAQRRAGAAQRASHHRHLTWIESAEPMPSSAARSNGSRIFGF